MAGAAGRYGEFGGHYVPEVLMSAIEELEFAYRQAQEDERFTHGARPAPEALRGPAHTPLPRGRADARVGRRAGSTSSVKTSLIPARTRSTTPSGQALLAQADGQDAHYRRDRRRTTRRRQRDGVRHARP